MNLGDTAEPIQAVMALSDPIRRLRALGVLRSRWFTGDLGEWYVATLYDGEQSRNQTQKGWDVKLPKTGTRLQVKAQSFDSQNQWNYLGSDPQLFDRLVLVVLTDSFTIKTLYDVLVADLLQVVRVGKEQKPNYYFSDFEPWRVDVSLLPGYPKIAVLVEQEACCGDSSWRQTV